MTYELEKQLQDKYAFMTISGPYCGYEPTGSPMDCQCGDGWFNIIDDLCSDITKVLSKAQQADLYILQIKEKYGELCFYFSGVDFLLIEDALVKAIERSLHTCEVCGKEGKLRLDRFWIQTLCDEHSKVNRSGGEKHS